jgi:hypothetical protein
MRLPVQQVQQGLELQGGHQVLLGQEHRERAVWPELPQAWIASFSIQPQQRLCQHR